MVMIREDVSFSSDGDTCAAWLYPAASDAGARPVIVMAHGLTGTRRDRLGAFADRFAAAGIAALVFDHRGFGDSTGEPDLFHPARQLDDWHAAIAFARSLPNIDADRVATFGSSPGGGNALAAAAEDPQVCAAISQVPFLDMRQAYSPSAQVTEEMRIAAAEGRYPPAVGQPDEAAFINAPGAEAGWRRVVAIGEESRWRNRVSAAWLTEAPYSQIHHAATLHCRHAPLPPRSTAHGSCAPPQTTRWPVQAPRLTPRAESQKVSSASIRVSTTSTSTTAFRTRRASPTNSRSFIATSLTEAWRECPKQARWPRGSTYR